MRRPAGSAVAQGLWMVVLWVVLWGTVTWANILSGIVVAVVLLLLLPIDGRTRGRLRVRPLPAVWFVVYFLFKLVQSNVTVAAIVLSPRRRVTSGIVAVPLPHCTDGMITLIANCITLTPGTLTLEVRRDPATLYIHVLDLRDVDAVRREVLQLRNVALRAFGTSEALDAFRVEQAARS